MTPIKRIHLNFFETACTGSHMSVGAWKDPKDNSRYKDRLGYYIWLAKLAEKGKITSIFFADTYSPPETYQNDIAATYRGGSQVAAMDPIIFISAMAAVTESVGFAVTGSTSYIAPYVLARTWSTLDHVTQGRIAWNVVTSYSNSAAKAMGREQVMSAPERYAAAHEYMDLTYRLWEASWEDGAQVWQAEPTMAASPWQRSAGLWADSRNKYNPKKIHKIDFKGKYHTMSGRHPTHPSPQRTPVLFQAGASKSGIEFAGKHAEALYCGSLLPPITATYVKAVRAEAAKNGRDPSTVKFFAGISPIVGRTLDDARAMYESVRSNIDVIGGLAKFSSHAAIDMSVFPLDEPFEFKGDASSNAIQGIVNNFKEGDFDGKPWTPRRLGEKIAFGGLYPMPVGTASMVADVMESWVKETDIDGFNMAYISNPDSYENIVEFLVPELQKRGSMWDDYSVPGGTLRENLYGIPGQSSLPEHHPGSKFKWNSPKPHFNGDAKDDQFFKAKIGE